VNAEDETLAAVLGRIGAGVRARRPPAGMRTRIVAIDGLGGAGKSSLAEHLSVALAGAAIVHTDDFASWHTPLEWWPRLIEEFLLPLARNEAARFERSKWGQEDRGWAEVQPADFVILEGVTAAREAFRAYLTYAVWVETPPELRLRRGLERDGQDAREQWETWMIREERYRIAERPSETADLVVPGDRNLWR
jgi:uridine kinase